MRSLLTLLVFVVALALSAPAGAQTTTTTAAPTTTTTAATTTTTTVTTTTVTTTTVTTTTTTTTSTTTTTTLPAASWTVIQNGNCSGSLAATGSTSAQVNCCRASNQGDCNKRDTSGGTGFSLRATLVNSGSQIYTSGGNSLVAAQLAKLNIDNIESMVCENCSLGHNLYIKFTTNSGKRAPKVVAFNGTTEASGTLSAEACECLVVGH